MKNAKRIVDAYVVVTPALKLPSADFKQTGVITVIRTLRLLLATELDDSVRQTVRVCLYTYQKLSLMYVEEGREHRQRKGFILTDKEESELREYCRTSLRALDCKAEQYLQMQVDLQDQAKRMRYECRKYLTQAQKHDMNAALREMD